jgi:hypothetical protein
MPKARSEDPSGHTVAQRTYYARQRAKGMVRLSVYIPDTERDAFWDAVDRLREDWHRRGLID